MKVVYIDLPKSDSSIYYFDTVFPYISPPNNKQTMDLRRRNGSRTRMSKIFLESSQKNHSNHRVKRKKSSNKLLQFS